MKHAIVQRDVAHLVLPDEVQELPALDRPGHPASRRTRARPRRSRRPPTSCAAPSSCSAPRREPAIVVGNGARATATRCCALAEHLDAPGHLDVQGEGHRCPTTTRSAAACSGARASRSPARPSPRPTACSCSARRSPTTRRIPTWVPTIQVDLDRMMLGKFHPVEVPLWGDIGRTLDAAARRRCRRSRRSGRPPEVARAGRAGGREKAGGATSPTPTVACTLRSCSTRSPRWSRRTRSSPSTSATTPTRFGHFFECRGRQDVLMSGYLGSIGFALPAAIGASVAVRRGGARRPQGRVDQRRRRPRASTSPSSPPSVKYGFPLTHVVLDNGELAKISREQLGAIRPVWETEPREPRLRRVRRARAAPRVRRHRPPTSCAPPSPRRSPSPTGQSLVAIATSNRDV